MDGGFGGEWAGGPGVAEGTQPGRGPLFSRRPLEDSTGVGGGCLGHGGVDRYAGWYRAHVAGAYPLGPPLCGSVAMDADDVSSP